MTTTYKGYTITQSGSDRFLIRLRGKNITTVKGSLGCAHFCIDSDYEDMTPQSVDQVQPVKHDNLYLSTDNYKLSGGYVKVEAECEKTNTWYNVYIPYSDIEFSLDIEEGELETYCLDDNATDGICTAANDIYERYLTGTTTYDIVFEKQKVKGYKFKSQLNKEHIVCASRFADIIEVERFREQNNYKSYSTILG